MDVDQPPALKDLSISNGLMQQLIGDVPTLFEQQQQFGPICYIFFISSIRFWMPSCLAFHPPLLHFILCSSFSLVSLFLISDNIFTFWIIIYIMFLDDILDKYGSLHGYFGMTLLLC